MATMISIATGRARRANAGARMAKLINEEETEKDEFYETAYDGGFNDEGSDQDNDYKADNEEDDDQVDSDFDIEENVDENQLDDDDEEGPKRSRRLITKAYKEPVAKKRKIVQTHKRTRKTSDEGIEINLDEPIRTRRQSSTAAKSTSDSSRRLSSDDDGLKKGKKRKAIIESESDEDFPDYEPLAYEPQPSTSKKSMQGPSERRVVNYSSWHDKKQVRTSTQQKSLEAEERAKERTKIQARRREYLSTRKVEYEMPTQEELMEETKFTEIINLESLAKFQQMELEKKKTKPFKAVPLGPRIRYHSVTMPDIQADDQAVNKPLIELIEDGAEKEGAPPLPPLPVDPQKGRKGVHERTFISFSDDNVLKEAFQACRVKPKQPETRYCALTKLKTPYFDPTVKAAFYNADVFRVMRAAYNRLLYHKGDRRNPNVRRYCEWLELEYPQVFNKGKIEQPQPVPSTTRSGPNKRKEKPVAKDSEQNEPVVAPESQKISPPPMEKSASTSVTVSESTDSAAIQHRTEKDSAEFSPISKKGPPVIASTASPSATPSLPYPSASPSKYRAPASRIVVFQKPAPTSPPPTLPNILRPTMTKPLLTLAKNASPVRLQTASSLMPVKTYPAKVTAVSSTAAPVNAVVTPASVSKQTVVNAVSDSTIVTIPAPTTVAAISNAVTAVVTTTPPPRQVLIAKRGVASFSPASGTVGASTIRGTPIVIRTSVPSQFSQRTLLAQGVKGGGSVIGVANPPTGGIQVGNTQVPLTLVNIRRDGPTVIRAGISPAGLNQMSTNQVVRLLQSQKIQIIQPPNASQTSGSPANAGLPLTLRLPSSSGSATQVVFSNSVACTTASALVASAAGIRPGARAILTSLSGVRSATGNPTMVFARNPGPSTGGDPTRLVKPVPAGVGQRLPSSIRTMTASQLKTVLSAGGAVVKSTPTNVMTSSVGGIRTTLSPGVRAITISTRQPGLTTMASAMLRPVSISSTGIRLNPNATIRNISAVEVAKMIQRPPVSDPGK